MPVDPCLTEAEASLSSPATRVTIVYMPQLSKAQFAFIMLVIIMIISTAQILIQLYASDKDPKKWEGEVWSDNACMRTCTHTYTHAPTHTQRNGDRQET